jgi:hypothetical protein
LDCARRIGFLTLVENPSVVGFLSIGGRPFIGNIVGEMGGVEGFARLSLLFDCGPTTELFCDGIPESGPPKRGGLFQTAHDFFLVRIICGEFSPAPSEPMETLAWNRVYTARTTPQDRCPRI